MRIVVTCGYFKSLHSIALIHQLSAMGHEVVLCLSVHLFNIDRLRFYLRQIGLKRLLFKVRDRLLSGKSGTHSVSEEVKQMLDYLQENAISSKTVHKACNSVHAKLVKVPSLNCPKALNALQEADSDIIVYAGGGILRRQFIESAKLGVLNAHGGPLPQFRGMNVSEWALFYGVKPNVTIHYIDVGIDTGPVFFSKPIPNKGLTNIPSLRGWGTQVSVEALLQAVEGISKASIHPTTQDIKSGRQFFVMAEPLLEVLQRWIDEGLTPVTDSTSYRWPGN